MQQPLSQFDNYKKKREEVEYTNALAHLYFVFWLPEVSSIIHCAIKSKMPKIL